MVKALELNSLVDVLINRVLKENTNFGDSLKNHIEMKKVDE